MITSKLNLRKVVAIAICLAATATMFAQTTDVYVGGNDNGKATIWKNGEPQYLAEDGSISSVVVVKGNVYAAGKDDVSFNAKVWKNGEELYVLGNYLVNSMAVSESGVVYVSGGSLETGVKVWKDGEVEDGYADADWLNCIFLDGTDIYATGYTTDMHSAVWKNGYLLYMSTGGVSIFVFDGDVYTTGSEYDSENDIWLNKLWKNNTTLYTSEIFGGTCIYISEGVIYMAGMQFKEEENIPAIWIDGDVTELAGGTYASSIFVSGSGIYVAGGGDGIAVLWANGTADTLATGGIYGTHSVFVVENGGIGVHDTESVNIAIYPNPVKDVLIIENGELKIENVEIYDGSGRKIVNYSLSTNQINVSALPQGIYFVKLEMEKGTVTKKFVKE